MSFAVEPVEATASDTRPSTPAILGLGGWQTVRPDSATTTAQSPIADRSFTGAPITNKN